MRKQLLGAGLVALLAATTTNAQTWEWNEWSACGPADPATIATCEVKTRTAYCAGADGQPAEDASICTDAKPEDQADSTGCAEEKICANNGKCLPATYTCECATGYTGDLCEDVAPPAGNYVWSEGAWSETCELQAVDQKCGAKAKTRTVTCVDADGAVADDSNCDAATKPTTADVTDCDVVGVCVENQGTCSNTTFTCDCMSGFVGDLCETPDNVTPPTGTWSEGTWSETCALQAVDQKCGSQAKTRTVTCVDTDGATVDDSNCDAATKPATADITDCDVVAVCVENQGTCSDTTFTCECVTGFTGDLCADPDVTPPAGNHTWSEGAWSETCEFQAVDQTCGAKAKTRTVTCVDADGAVADDSNCDAATKPTTADVTDCDVVGVCVENQGTCSNTTFTCDCAEGFKGTLCDTPDVSGNVWTPTAWSETCEPQAVGQTCGLPAKTRNVTCVAPDGSVVDEINCDATTKPPTIDTSECTVIAECVAGQGTCSDDTFTCVCQNGYDGELCADESTHFWVLGEYGACESVANQTCGQQVKTRSWVCTQRSDNTPATDDALCTSPQPADETTTEDCAIPQCANGGSCNAESFVCECVNDWTGDLCEVPPPFYWAPEPWSNCTTKAPEHVCGATYKTHAYYCHKSADNSTADDSECPQPKPDPVESTEECDVLTCQNAGQCVDNTFVCQCANGFTGEVCEDVAPHKWMLGEFGECKNQVANQICGSQHQEAAPKCVTNDETATQVADEECDIVVKPQSDYSTEDCSDVATCQNDGSCYSDLSRCSCSAGWVGTLCETEGYHYVAGQWGECLDKDPENKCDIPQVQTRVVECREIATDFVVDATFCQALNLEVLPAEQVCESVGTCENNGAFSPMFAVAAVATVVAAAGVAF